MRELEAIGQRDVFETPQVKDDTESAESHFKRGTPMLAAEPVYAIDLANWVAEYCANKAIPASRHRLILAALISVFEWMDFRYALDDLVRNIANEVIEKVANCSLENPNCHDGVDLEVGFFSEWMGLIGLLNDATEYLPLIAGDLLPERL